MKNEENNDTLRKVLKEWRVTTPLPPRFQEQVWQRIARVEAGATPGLWVALRNWLETALPRRTAAVSYFAVVLAVGLTAGHWRGRQKAAELQDRLSARYVQSVDPYQMPRP
jgi:hypothetical protein